MSLNWHVVHTHLRQEQIASINLANQGFNIFLPRCRQKKSHARKIYETCAPLFPRYLFVEFDKNLDNWRVINNTKGVVYLLQSKSNFQPLIVPNAVITGLQQQLDAEGLLELSCLELFKPGDLVYINKGPFEGYTAKYKQLTAKDRVEILINFMSRETNIEVPLCTLEKT